MEICVAACQILSYPDPQRSADKVLHWLKKAAKRGVDVIAFPEACLCGYTCDPIYWAHATPQDFERAEARIIEAAKDLDIAVVLGSAHWGESTCGNAVPVFNSLLVIDKGGAVRGRYAKTHLAEDWSTPGKTLPIYSLAGVDSCFLVCHDIRYPELVRLPAIVGAQICYFCSCESGLLAEYKLSAYRAMPISRAAENTIYLVMANAPADPKNMDSPSQSHGNSKIIDPQGNVLDEAGYFEERLVAVTIDLEAATRAMARRAVNDETILRPWLLEGTRFVTKESSNSFQRSESRCQNLTS